VHGAAKHHRARAPALRLATPRAKKTNFARHAHLLAGFDERQGVKQNTAALACA